MMDNKNNLQVVFVSVDPNRDIGKLDNFANAFNSSFVGLTAQQDELVSISKALGVYHEVVASQKLAKEDHASDDGHSHSHYDIDHTGSYLLFNPKLELTALLTSPHEPAPMAKAIDKIIEAL
jgi:protein SCO1/2